MISLANVLCRTEIIYGGFQSDSGFQSAYDENDKCVPREIKSNQIKALAAALVEEINKELRTIRKGKHE